MTRDNRNEPDFSLEGVKEFSGNHSRGKKLGQVIMSKVASA